MQRLLSAALAALLAVPSLPAAGADPARAASEPFRAALVADIAAMEALLDAMQALRGALGTPGGPDVAIDPSACDTSEAVRALCAEMPESVR